MSYTALYRKYRPNNFANVVGQEVIVKILKNSIINNNISHAFLFSGPRGTGKTSVAKIFAHAVNCLDFADDICNTCKNCMFLKENDSDIIEIDAASNNGVEEIRILRDNVKLLPSFCKYKVYIIDEVHMLSTGAFNALLKTLEEPPSHVIFILATTEPNKIPLTILSRCQRFDFNSISMEALNSRLSYILESENKTLSPSVIRHISELSGGGLRDAINLLDQILSLNNSDVTIEEIDKINGNISKDMIFTFFKYLLDGSNEKVLSFINNMANDCKNFADFINQLLIVLRDIVINNQVSNYFDEEYSKKLDEYVIDTEVSVKIAEILNTLLKEIKNSSDQILLIEIYSMHITQVINNYNKKEIKENNSHVEPVRDNIEEKEEDKSLTDEKLIDENINDTLDIVTSNEKNEDSYESNNDLVDTSNQKNQTNNAFQKLKEIRINNVLYGANKDILKSVLQNYDEINYYISNKNYNTLSALLLDGKVVVASDEYLLFSFPDESYISRFDSIYKSIELFMNEIYGKTYKVVAVTDIEWSHVKNNFIENKKNNIPYTKIEENDVKLEESDNFSELENSALNIFGENTVSVK